MLLILNLALPWIILWGVSLVESSSVDPNFWLLQGMPSHLSLYGIPVLTQKTGILGLYIPLAVMHNFTYIFARLIQSRMDLDFLPMIRSVLAWVGGGLLAYWTYISFLRGAKFGEFHNLILLLIPVMALCVGLAFFIKKEKSRAAAQMTAMLVAWTPAFSLVATLAGNHMRPQDIFGHVTFEPGAKSESWDNLNSGDREGFLRLSLQKENISLPFPSLVRKLQVKLDAHQNVEAFTGELDPIARQELLLFPEQIEDAGWRPLVDNQQIIATLCNSGHTQQDTQLIWVKSNAQLSLTIHQCRDKAQWSVSSKTAFFALGSLSNAEASKFRERRLSSNLSLKDVDLGLLSLPDWRQRKLGLALLAQVNDVSAIPLIGKAFYDQDVEVRQTAAHILLSWGANAETFLTQALKDPSPSMRGDTLRIVALALRHTPHPAAFKLLSDPDTYVRVSAVQALRPFIKENLVIKTLMQILEKQYDQYKSSSFFNEPFHAELVSTLAESKDVRVAGTLLKVLPTQLSPADSQAGKVESVAAQSLRAMTNWMNVDYLQAVVRRSSNLETRQKALAIMARWREAGDEAIYVKSLQSPELRDFALTLQKEFPSETVKAAAEAAPIPLQAR